MGRLLLVLLMGLMAGSAAASRQSHGFEFAESLAIAEGVTLDLQTLRETQRRFLPWQVLAFYARAKPEQGDELRLGLQPFVIDIVWLQEQSTVTVTEWWQEAFERHEPDPARRAELDSRMARLLELYREGVAHGQRTRVSYLPDAGVRVQHAQSEPLALVGLDMARLLVAIGLGTGPTRGEGRR